MFERLSLQVVTIATAPPSLLTMEGASYMRELGDESAVEVHKPHEGLNLGDILRGKPISNAGDFDGIHFDASF